MLLSLIDDVYSHRLAVLGVEAVADRSWSAERHDGTRQSRICTASRSDLLDVEAVAIQRMDVDVRIGLGDVLRRCTSGRRHHC
jgi:hypothetical protein